MNKGGYLIVYYKTLEAAPLDVSEEYEGGILAVLEDYNALGRKPEVKELESDLKKVVFM